MQAVIRVVRSVGWTLIVAGCVVLLYVVYLLWFTGLETVTEQRDLADRFQAVTEAPAEATEEATEEPDATVEVGDAYAAMWFERDGERIVHGDVLYVVEGTSVADLKRGPGHYPDSAAPGQEGNLAIAGHRTTYGSPFGELAELTDGDTIHVVDRAGTEWVYAYREQRVVSPEDVWVVGHDPLETGTPTITLTTCHPRFSAAQRLIAWGELVGPAA
ncbi:class E sortase [Nitriliruptor alkaliphilus]|uniref:class E sortase n=1 Tax=Nitriliruptor alkaliphilus TaxID=427918 RepID=UPI000696F3A4|nr:class E sortase [Nitriliruptor alkaliphilus]